MYLLMFISGALLAGCSSQTTGGVLTPVGECVRPELMPINTGACSVSSPCLVGQRCVDSTCVPDVGSCTSDVDCRNDTACHLPTGSCVPRGTFGTPTTDATCRAKIFAPDQFQPPVLKCQWPPAGTPALAYRNVVSTPMVADLNKDGQPEIIFAAGLFTQNHLVAISGKDCSVVFDKVTNISSCSHLAIGDVDGDGFPEIIVQEPGVTVYDRNGNKLASATTGTPGSCTPEYPPLIANLDGQGSPEIVSGGFALRYEALPMPRLVNVWTVPTANGGTLVNIPLADDFDGDGKLDVLIGKTLVDGVTGVDKSKSILSTMSGLAAVGDFNKDGHPDLVFTASNQTATTKVTIVDYFNNTFLMPTQTIATSLSGGPPTVADFDGDGTPDVGIATSNAYYAFSLDCLQAVKPAKCKGSVPGVLWQSTTQDGSSAGTGSSLFDFNGDGKAEIVYRDECWLRGYNATDGTKLFAVPVTSATANEMPVVADVDNDGHAEIVVSSDDYFGAGNCQNAISGMEFGRAHPGTSVGVHIYEDPQDRYLPSRSIWNQHTYHITNVNNDATIPLVEIPNWSSFNNYRLNVQGTVAGDALAIADVTASDAGTCTSVVRANVCNRGTAAMPVGVPVSFYGGDPRGGGPALCVARTAGVILPGRCEEVSCTPSSTGQAELWIAVNNDGTSTTVLNECKAQANNLARICGAPSGGCTATAGCRADQICDVASGVCAPPPASPPECTATEDAQCSARGLVCDTQRARCGYCATSQDCGSGRFCDTRCGVCRPTSEAVYGQITGGGLGCNLSPTGDPAGRLALFLMGAAVAGIALRSRRRLHG